MAEESIKGCGLGRWIKLRASSREMDQTEGVVHGRRVKCEGVAQVWYMDQTKGLVQGWSIRVRVWSKGRTFNLDRVNTRKGCDYVSYLGCV